MPEPFRLADARGRDSQQTLEQTVEPLEDRTVMILPMPVVDPTLRGERELHDTVARQPRPGRAARSVHLELLAGSRRGERRSQGCAPSAPAPSALGTPP